MHDSHMLEDVSRIRALAPEQRFVELANTSRFLVALGAKQTQGSAFDPERLLQMLAEHHVRFVLTGALGARFHGFPRMTEIADITPACDAENLNRLAAALRELNARVFTDSVPEGLPFDCSATMLARAPLWNLATDAGRIDLVFEPAGTGGYDDLAANAVRQVMYGSDFLIASLEDILRSKVAADRPQDRQDAMVIRQMIARRK